MWFVSGTDVSLGIDFLVDGQFVVPDTASYALRSYDGAALTSGALTATSTSEVLTIPLVWNALTGANLFETRFVFVSFMIGTKTHQMNLGYTLSDFVPTTATADKVRAEIGLDYVELSDADIGVNEAYFQIVEQITIAPFLSAGNKAVAANVAVAVRAALNVSESFDLRTAINRRAEDNLMSRKASLDFDQITSRLRAKLAALLTTAKGESAVSSTIFLLTTPTDVITNT